MANLFYMFIGTRIAIVGGMLVLYGASNHLRQTHDLPAIKRSLGSAHFRLADDSRELTCKEIAEFERQHPGYFASLRAKGIPLSPDCSKEAAP